ncbi:MAG: hypothetical protein JOZ65_19480 [Chloroflexi bacterium]|nr:hypothetical protein [Chloroflexota bacterium]
MSDQYCNICNGFQYQTQIMTNDEVRTSHIVDTDQLYKDIRSGELPAVSFVKPSGWVDSHPASSKWDLFEGFTKKIVDEVRSNPELWESTAIFVTTDEGGGYHDSGYVQRLDFFGDGTRISLIVVSRWTEPGHISHNYADHVSILKFIERNWHLPPISGRSRDNPPNPRYNAEVSRYAPTNGPQSAICSTCSTSKPASLALPRLRLTARDPGEPGWRRCQVTEAWSSVKPPTSELRAIQRVASDCATAAANAVCTVQWGFQRGDSPFDPRRERARRERSAAMHRVARSSLGLLAELQIVEDTKRSGYRCRAA